MNKIAIIGAGQLGSRHLQALANVEMDTIIEVVDPSSNSLEVAKQRFEEIPTNKKIQAIKFLESMDELSESLDVVIVATSSDIRFKVVQNLMEKKQVKFLILEKVLFQRLSEYEEIDNLLEASNTKCWVNHPRRMFPFYQKLKSILSNSGQINYMVQGGDWGLACNGLHFLDHLSFLTNEIDLNINTHFLDDKIHSSKRKGFVEFYGELKGNLGEHNFSISSFHSASPIVISIHSDSHVIVIDESNGFARISAKTSNWKAEVHEEKIIYFQSELTDILVKDLLLNSKCDLPSFENAMALHVPFLKSLTEKMSRIDGESHEICPIT